MTINKVIERVRAIKADALDDETKGQWLVRLEGRLFREVILPHIPAGAPVPPFAAVHRWPEDADAELLAEPPYDRLYELYLMSQIDLYYQDTDSYAQTAAAYNDALDEWRAWYNRNNRPRTSGGYTNVF